MFQEIYEARYATTDLVLLQSNAGKHSPKIESTSVWNQFEVGTGFGKDQPRDEVPSPTVGLPPKLDCALDSADVDFSVPSNTDFSLSQSITDIALARDSLLARSLSVASTELFSTTTGEEVLTLAPVTFPPFTLSVGESGSVLKLSEKLPPFVPERLSLNSNEDMVTDNLQKAELNKLKTYEKDILPTNCYKGKTYQPKVFKLLNSCCNRCLTRLFPLPIRL